MDALKNLPSFMKPSDSEIKLPAYDTILLKPILKIEQRLLTCINSSTLKFNYTHKLQSEA